MGIQINGSTDRITAIDGTIDFVSNIGNIGLITASRYELLDSITIGAGSTVIKTVNGKLGIGTGVPADLISIGAAANTLAFGCKDTTRYNHVWQLLNNDNSGNAEFRMYKNSVTGTHAQSINFATSGDNNYILDGNFGIGTNNPSDIDSIGKSLNIASSTGGAIYLQDTDAPTTKFAAISYNGATAALQIHAHHSSSYIDLGTNGTPRVRIDPSGRLLIGTTSHQEAYGTSALQIAGTTGATSSMSLIRHGNSPYLTLGSSGGSSLGDVNALSSGNRIGQITFAGADGTDINTHAASIAAYVDGSVSSNNVPARIVFATGPSETERLRITNGGDIETKGLNQFNFNSDWSAKARNINVFPCDDVSNWFSFIGTNLRFTDGGNFVKPSDNSNSNWGNIAGIAFEGVNQNNSSGNHPAIRFVVDQPGGNGSNYSLGSGNSGKTAAIDNNTVMCISGNGNVGINATNPNSKLLVIDDSATQTTILKLRNYKSGVNTQPTLTFEASTSAGQGANSSIQGLAGTDAGGAANANDSGMKFLVAYGGSGTGREAFRIKRDGNVYFPAGQGIDFSATSDATGMTSELFSDYERGVHTFSVMGAGGNPTVSIQNNYHRLYYTKIGDMVHVTGEMRWTISSHGSGDLKISLPFTADSSAQSNCQGTAQTWNVNWAWRTESRDLWSEVSPGHNYMRFRIGGSNSLNEDYLDCGSSYQKTSNSNYGVEYQVSLWYRTG